MRLSKKYKYDKKGAFNPQTLELCNSSYVFVGICTFKYQLSFPRKSEGLGESI